MNTEPSRGPGRHPLEGHRRESNGGTDRASPKRKFRMLSGVMGFSLAMTGAWAAKGAAPVAVAAESAGGSRPPAMVVTVQGERVPVIEHRVGSRLNCVYAPLTLPGSAEVAVEMPGGIGDWSVSPVQCGVAARVEEGRLKLTLLTSHHLVVRVNGMRLLLLAEPPEEALPPGRPVLDVSQPPYSVDRSGAKDGTAVLQQACDDAGALANHAVVLLPPGRYTTTGLSLRGSTQFCLARGAVLQGSARGEDYPEYPDGAGKTGCTSLLRVEGVEHVRIFGGGTLDARGAGLAGAVAEREAPRLLARCVTVERSRCVTLQDVICKESSQAAVRFSHCEDVAARRVVVINDLGSEIPVDGIWVGGSQRVLVEDCLVHTTEDAFVVAAPEGAVTEQVVMRRLVALCGGRALRCGPQGAGNMDRVRFEEVDVVRARDAMDIMHGEGSGEWTDITFREIRVEKWVRQGIALQLFGGGSLKGVRFENLSFATPIRGVMNGFSAAHRVSDITMAGLAVEGRPALNAAAAGIEVGPFVEDLRFDEW